MEVVQQHELQDIYRIENGVLLKVNKHKRGRWVSVPTNTPKRTYTKRVKGLSGGLQIARDMVIRDNVTVPAGTILINHQVVIPITNPQEFSYELKFSGGAIGGNFNHFLDFSAEVREIMDSYYRRGNRYE